MKLFKLFQKFAKADSGAVTVDWVVLTAAIVGLGVATVAGVRDANQSVADRISEYVMNQQVN